MKIFLDDITTGERVCPPGFIHLTTAQEVIEALKTGTVDEISLDNDLGDEAIVGSGYRVAQWIEEAAFNNFIPRLKWNIHSQNPVAVKKMKIALENASTFWDKFSNDQDSNNDF